MVGSVKSLLEMAVLLSFSPLEIKHAENKQSLRISDQQSVGHLVITTSDLKHVMQQNSKIETYKTQNFLFAEL